MSLAALAAPVSLAPGTVIAYVLADLAIILIAARLVGAVFVRLRQPRIVGEMVAGILVGPTVLGGQLARGAITALGRPATDGAGLVNDLYPLQAYSFLNLLGLLALVFYMLLVGLEVEQRYLAGRGRQIVLVALAVVAGPVAMGFLVGGLLDSPAWRVEGVSDTTHALFVGAGLAVTAFPVMARILQEKRLIASEMGAIGIGAAAVVTPLMFIAVAGAAASATGGGVVSTIAFKTALAVVLVLVLFAVVRPLLAVVIGRLFDNGRPLDPRLLAIILAGALVTALIADRIGIHSLNGAFLFGAAVPQVPGLAKAVLDKMLDFVASFLIPVFLAVSGLQTDLRVITGGMLGGIALFLAAMVVGKWGIGFLAGRAVGLKPDEANTIGVLMNCRGLMILVVALLGTQAGVITAPMQVAFVVGAIVTTLMTGPLVDRFLPVAAEPAPSQLA